MIRPEFWEDSKMARLKPIVRLFYIAMWNFADDEGYLKDDPDWLKIKCFPYNRVDIPNMLADLFALKRIDINNGIIKINKFLKYQVINRPYPSELKNTFNAHSMNTPEHSHNKYKLKEVKRSKEKEKIKTPLSFEDSPYYNIDTFRGALQAKGWLPQKIDHFYDAAIQSSNRGNKYINWILAVEKWAKKDDKKDYSSKPQKEKAIGALAHCQDCNWSGQIYILPTKRVSDYKCQQCGTGRLVPVQEK